MKRKIIETCCHTNGNVKGLVRRKALRKPFGMDCMRTGFWVRVLGSGCYND